MGLIDSVKNLVARIWAFLEKMVASEVKHLAEQKVKEKAKEKVEEKVEDIKETVSEVLEEVKGEVATKAKALKKRARTKAGRYVGDNPRTKKNEAYEDKK